MKTAVKHTIRERDKENKKYENVDPTCYCRKVGKNSHTGYNNYRIFQVDVATYVTELTHSKLRVHIDVVQDGKQEIFLEQLFELQPDQTLIMVRFRCFYNSDLKSPILDTNELFSWHVHGESKYNLG